MRDPYEVLGVAKGASLEALKEAFRRLCRQHHPDFPGGSQEAMREVLVAYGQALEERALAEKKSSEIPE